MFDLKISNARICDGLGNPIAAGEVGVLDGKIAAVAAQLGPATETIDAKGMVLAPGLVDVHTHYDAQITWDNTATPSPANGVTTVIIGNCGFTIAPCKPRDREIVLKDLTKVEGIPYKVLDAGVNWNFETFEEYLDSLEKNGAVPNIACFAGHSSIRTWVMGEDSRQRSASDDEIDAMCKVLGDALDAGAIGFSTSLSESHNGHCGFPVPSRLADDREIHALVRVLGKKNIGTFQITRSNVATIESFGKIADLCGRPVQFSAIMTSPGFPGKTRDEMRAIDALRAEGKEVWAHVTPFPELMQFTLKNPFPMEALNAWKSVMESANLQEMKNIYRDVAFRQSVKLELETPVPFRFNGQWEVVEVVRTENPDLSHNQGRNLEQIGAEENKHPFDAFLDIALDDDLGTRFQAKTLNYDEKYVRPLLDHPHSVVSLGDAGAHVTFFCQAGTGIYLLQRYVRECGNMKLEEAIRLVTSHAADTHRVPDRGRISVGAWADLFLFDPDTIALGENKSVADLPAGVSRIDRAPIGVQGVWVNGKRVVDGNGMLSNPPLAGQVLREFTS